MNNIQKNPDKKLHIGAKMGLITNIISIIWTVIIAIILIAASSIIFSKIEEIDPATGSLVGSVSTILIVGLVIALSISIGLSITIVIMCNNVLKGNAESGLVAGILLLVLAGLSLFSVFLIPFSFLSGIDLIFLGLNIASGVLLIIGKYNN